MSSLSTRLPGDPNVPAYVLDADRLAALRQSGLLTRGPEEEFDRLTRMAAGLIEAPISRLSIVDDTGQHFKSAIGALPPSGRFTPLTHAICKHVVGDRAPVCVPNTIADGRVAHNGAVTEHGTGAYLGQPVHSPDGHVLGALCVADPDAHAWTERDLEVLADLAAAVETELALRAALEAAHMRVYRDALTGLRNRRALSADLEEAIGSGRAIVLVLADLDGFKTYNDRYGHAAGDRMLVRMARGLRQIAEQLRGSAYRMSGDEFCVVCEQPSAAATAVTQQVVQALQRTTVDCPIGASAGRVCIPAEATSADDALELADERMYAHKRSGRLSTAGQVRNALRSTLAMHDPVLAQRGEAAAELAGRAAQILGFDAATGADVALACELGDIGMLAHRGEPVLLEHPIASQQVLLTVPALTHISGLVRAHHERIDGSGFPDRLAGAQLGHAERLVSAATALVELSEPGGAPGTMPATQALEILRAQGAHDPAVLDALGACSAIQL